MYLPSILLNIKLSQLYQFQLLRSWFVQLQSLPVIQHLQEGYLDACVLKYKLSKVAPCIPIMVNPNLCVHIL